MGKKREGSAVTSAQAMGDRIRSLRIARGWTTDDMIRACRKKGALLDKAKVSHIEHGTRRGGVSLRTLLVLAEVLDTTPDYLLGKSRDQTPSR
jgi:transcriptional regulator with XRE-family HTH domain